MKEYSLSKEENDQLQRLFSVFSHYDLVRLMADKEIKAHIVGVIFPRLSLKPEDFPHCKVDVGAGKILFDEKAKAKVVKPPPEKPQRPEGWKEIKGEGKEVEKD